MGWVQVTGCVSLLQLAARSTAHSGGGGSSDGVVHRRPSQFVDAFASLVGVLDEGHQADEEAQREHVSAEIENGVGAGARARRSNQGQLPARLRDSNTRQSILSFVTRGDAGEGVAAAVGDVAPSKSRGLGEGGAQAQRAVAAEAPVRKVARGCLLRNGGKLSPIVAWSSHNTRSRGRQR